MKHVLNHDAIVVSNHQICSNYHRIILQNESISETASPGQFVSFRIDGRPDVILRRPFSIALTTPEKRTFEIVYQVVGKGTLAMTGLDVGRTVNLLGPFGSGFHLPNTLETILLVAGGCGVAGLSGLASQLRRAKHRIIALLGFQCLDRVFGEEVFRTSCDEIIVTTEDGSYGLKGLVSDHLPNVLNKGINKAYLCGPAAMLKAVIPMISNAKINGEVSLEERMGCGYGVCLSCAVPVSRNGKVERVRVCKEGPVFDISEVFIE
jgi:dihydroorotate dehydrogenase electron transfer subunit